MKISVFGAGAWGMALALLLYENGHKVTLRSSSPERASELASRRANPRLGGVELPPGIHVTASVPEASGGAELAVVATTSTEIGGAAELLRRALPRGCAIVCGSKGIEPGSYRLFSELLRDTFGEERAIAALSGPAHAEEVARRIPTACVAASRDKSAAEMVQDVFMNEYFRVYTSDDVTGVELGAALKNVIALCAGICDGLGFGDNTIAMLATRGLAEIAHLVIALGGRRETVAGLAGLGDLIATCTSRHSRNRRAGVLIGRGKSAQDAMDEVGAAVEGYHAAKAARALSERAGVDMPICAEAYSVLYDGKDPRAAIHELMTRTKRSETEESFMR
ncbi:MAG: NAD(P)-dependent glycerol-3-phosphate dehydrogenase [Oscillospiraceae bacterium]|jgi:glycerol-3-phosphate dehydrogenase (NAD(P)+)|nr:NAD(P)-dependent glycerol-3-phosphate dehydrogenase [Oscillospiraceae bacterium]